MSILLTLKHLFTPHYTNNHRSKVLHPSGLLSIIGIFLVFSGLTRFLSQNDLPRGLILGYASSINASQVIELTNAERAKAGLSGLSHNSLLTQAALAKASNMFQLDYWAHVAPDGTTPWVFIRNAGYNYAVAGENLARDFGDTPSMMQGWMNSPTHKENIINSKYSEIGVAVVNGKLQGVETTLVVQMFGKPASALAQTGPASSTVRKKPPPPTNVLTQTTPNPTPTPLPEVAKLPESQVPPSLTAGVTLSENITRQAGSIWISPMTLTKSVATSIMMMLIGVLLYDEFLIHKHRIPRRVGKNWAHLTLFGIVLMMVVAITQGKIL
jgi:uncharacterized protein YkwD